MVDWKNHSIFAVSFKTRVVLHVYLNPILVMAKNPNTHIIGYELVKDCTKATGVERGRQDHLFVVKRKCNGDYYNNIVEVAKNGNGTYDRLTAQYPFNDYIIWFGTVWGDEIIFHWS